MRILHLMAGAAQGGAETAFVDTCIAMAEAGFEIEAATRPNDSRVRRLTDAGIRVHLLPFGGRFDRRTKRALRGVIRDFQPQIVQTWLSRAGQKAPRWRPRDLRRDGAPRYLVVSRLGGYYAPDKFPSTDYFTVIAPDIGKFLVANGIAPERIALISNFAETEEAGPPVDRARLQTPSDAPLLLALGRLHRAKAFDILLQAMADVPGAYLWIAGEGPERDALAAQCRDLGLDGRVRFLGWRDDRAALFRAADICVFPSRYEAFGTVFLQAWAQEKPLVVTAADGPRQFVRDGSDGLLVPVDDTAALAGALRRICGDLSLREQLVAGGLARYRNEFTKEKIMAAYRAFFQAILARENLAG